MSKEPIEARKNEFYFDYSIERVLGAESIAEPKLYFEKDYCNADLPYHIFAVPKEWLDKGDTYTLLLSHSDNKSLEMALDALAYDSVKVIFDANGISCYPLLDEKSDELKNVERPWTTVSFEQFYRNGCRIAIETPNSKDHSGVGVIEMIKSKKVVSRFFFATNCNRRTYIDYKLDVAGDKVNMVFSCSDSPKGVPVALACTKGRLPCLGTDISGNRIEEFVLDFNGKTTFKHSFKLSEELTDKNSKFMFSVGIADEVYEKYYLLHCTSNDSIHIERNKETFPKVGYTCPFCHEPIDRNIVKSPRYKHGGISCHMPSVGDKTATEDMLPTILTEKKALAKKSMFCANDLQFNSSDQIYRFDHTRTRLLPSDYMSHVSFKVAFVGSTRAGKTTYISRMFGVTGTDNKVSMPMTMTANSLKKFGLSVQSANIEKLELILNGAVKDASTGEDKDNHYRIANTKWTDTQDEYRSRAITLHPSRYPERTTTGNSGKYTTCPFVAEVNKKSYVAFYDIAGEDAQNAHDQIRRIANDQRIGVFCVINGHTDQNNNNSVLDELKKAELDKKCPIAVIVTKMDTLENEFDSSCRCLRSDYLDIAQKYYSGSSIEKEIDYSSEEIKSFLRKSGLMPDFDGTFENVRYFGVSSFNFLDSIHDNPDKIDDKGKVVFECSAKRIELPVLWMLKQFGIIK